MSDLLKKVREEANKSNPSAYITLFVLRETNPVVGVAPTIYRFTSSVYSDSPISFGGDEYQAIPIEADGFELKSSGTLPTPTISVALNGNPIGETLRVVDDFIGWEVTRIRTFATFLDSVSGGDTPDPSAILASDVYRIERKIAQTLHQIQWELQAVIDQEGMVLPRRQLTRDFCSHVYRTWDSNANMWNYKDVTCPYAGTTSFNEANKVVASKDDACGRTVRSCTARFGRGTSLPTTAFPGLNRT